VQNEANIIQDANIYNMKYDASQFTLYTPVKNHIVAWDLLTGTISSTLRNQTIGEITTFGIFKSPKIVVLGDTEGNLILRKI
jgi:hypothetical protein